MKAQTKNTHRILSTIGLLILAVTIGYGQGLLAEGAMKLFKINQAKAEVNVPVFTFVNNTEEKDSFSVRDLFDGTFQKQFEKEVEAYELEAGNITRTISASAIEISFESDIETEQWMTTPLSDNLEAGNEVENWMTESFSETVEADLTVENWMAEPLSGSLETDLTVENWMTESFSESVEADMSVENWMTESFSGSVESELEVENWMKVSLDESLEEELVVEDWMLTSLK